MTHEPPDSTGPTFELSTKGVTARAQQRGSEFVVLAGSGARAQVANSYEQYVSSGYRAHRERLIADGGLQADEATGELRFVRDTAFGGSTEAGCVVAGRMANGLRDWSFRSPDGSKKTHGDWLDELASTSQTPIFILKVEHLMARAQMREGKLVVLAGSESRPGFSGGMDAGDRELKEELLAQGVLTAKPDTRLLEFTVDTPFKSASAATGVILWRPRGGTSGWVFTDAQGNEIGYGNWMGMLSRIPPEVRRARLGFADAIEETVMPETPEHRQEILAEVISAAVPLNQILYGPPGTGKTFQVVERALAILDPALLAEHLEDRAMLKTRYDELVAAEAISFVTFHQSFGYEDFIEGIKPVMQGGQLSYRLEDGIFLESVRAAGGKLALPEGAEQQRAEVIAPATAGPDAQVWRLYIDGAAPVSQVRERCLERGEIRIGSWNQPPKDLTEISSEDLNSSQTLFRDGVRVGDVVLLAVGSDLIGAVGIVTGEYTFDPGGEPMFSTNYAHARSVNWLATFLKASAQEVTGRRFAPPTLQRVAGLSADDVLQHLGLSRPESQAQPGTGPRPHVLIIDEINRGNVAKIFGELITLLESEKRAGRPEALIARLPLSRRALSVPDTLYVIGTMNTADRSLTQLDTALRRRFVFHPVWPEPRILPVLEIDGEELDLRKFLYAINDRIERLLSREQVIGHAYLMGLPSTLAGVASALRERILPQLEEYFFDDWSKIREVFADQHKETHLQFVQQDTVNGEVRYRINAAAFEHLAAFTGVYSLMNADAFPFEE
ncbi:AAA family ATPase [Deinococcus radiopugnans]|uniref:AAA family ATPase n=1 Tax=Deinococcus radiopugnans TaxID=57497 RepID=UPI00068ABBD1|nr:AAA family ATPase [Deinococcus radiopugnans]